MNNPSKNPLYSNKNYHNGFFWHKKYKDYNPFLMDYNRIFCGFIDADHIMTIKSIIIPGRSARAQAAIGGGLW